MPFLVLIFLLLGQTTLLAKHFSFLRPDLPLIFLILIVSGRGWWRGLAWGAVTGLLLDLFMGGVLTHFFLYCLLGLIFGFISGDFFKNYRILVTFNIILATFLIYFLPGHLLLANLNYLGFKFCLRILILNLCWTWCFSFLPLWGINNEE